MAEPRHRPNDPGWVGHDETSSLLDLATTCAAPRCGCSCHRFPGVKHVAPCCSRTYQLDGAVSDTEETP